MGKDLISSLNLKASPMIGELLTETQIAYIEDKIFDSEDAIRFAADYLEHV